MMFKPGFRKYKTNIRRYCETCGKRIPHNYKNLHWYKLKKYCSKDCQMLSFHTRMVKKLAAKQSPSLINFVKWTLLVWRSRIFK